VLAVAAVAGALFWFTKAPDSPAPVAAIAAPTTAVAPGSSEQPDVAPTPLATTAPLATATVIPTPTAPPIPKPFDELIGTTPELALVLSSPLGSCQLTPGDPGPVGTQTLRCLGEVAVVPVAASAPGRIVGVVREPAPSSYAEAAAPVASDAGESSATQSAASPAVWSWSEQVRLGPHVIIDHGRIGGSANVQTVYAGLESIADDIALGSLVEAGAEIGTIQGPQAQLRYGLWDAGAPNDQSQVRVEGPSLEEQRRVAAALREQISSPTDPRCPLALNFSSLPGAARPYRNGTHQGIDFGCGAAGRSVSAIADGTVVYLVDDYVDPTVPNREAILANAGLAGFTPFWTLAMLYGNVVVVDHGVIEGAGRVVTISAHLEAVDEAITLGSSVSQGDRLGEIGNRGTNASARRIRGADDPSLHLHWELFIDNWFLGAGQPGQAVAELITTALCGAAATAGCPA